MVSFTIVPIVFSITDRLVRVEKYRPSSLDDVSGHQDILATINRFVETNVTNAPDKSCTMGSE